jgi:2-polyprenyl-3-methyl-5-hydroxy-6-metoxy-1,4-benzoquinol methylase
MSAAPLASPATGALPDPGLRPTPADAVAAVEDAPVCPGCAAPLPAPVLLRSPDRLIGGPGEFTVRACPTCGLASTVPRLAPEQFADFYPQTYYPERAAQAGRLGGLVERTRLGAIIALGPYRPLARRTPGRMLDVGCGSGELVLAFARRGWSVSGVEPSAQAAARAGAGGVEVHTGTLDDAPWTGPTFDAIVLNHSLEHVPDPLATLRQAAALLTPGGVLAVAVPNFGCWQRRLFGARWFQLDLPRHLQHFEVPTLAALIVRAGLTPNARTYASMRPSLLLSLQYTAFGRARWSGRGLRLAAWAIAPLLLALDRVSPGDCLHMFAVRGGDRDGRGEEACGREHRGGEACGREHRGGEACGREHRGGEAGGREHRGGEAGGREHRGGEARGREHRGGEARGREHRYGENQCST